MSNPATVTRNGVTIEIPGDAWDAILAAMNWVLAGDNHCLTGLPDDGRHDWCEWASALQFQGWECPGQSVGCDASSAPSNPTPPTP